jgi:hypothetical protein
MGFILGLTDSWELFGRGGLFIFLLPNNMTD